MLFKAGIYEGMIADSHNNQYKDDVELYVVSQLNSKTCGGKSPKKGELSSYVDIYGKGELSSYVDIYGKGTTAGLGPFRLRGRFDCEKKTIEIVKTFVYDDEERNEAGLILLGEEEEEESQIIEKKKKKEKKRKRRAASPFSKKKGRRITDAAVGGAAAAFVNVQKKRKLSSQEIERLQGQARRALNELGKHRRASICASTLAEIEGAVFGGGACSLECYDSIIVDMLTAHRSTFKAGSVKYKFVDQLLEHGRSILEELRPPRPATVSASSAFGYSTVADASTSSSSSSPSVSPPPPTPPLLSSSSSTFAPFSEVKSKKKEIKVVLKHQGASGTKPLLQVVFNKKDIKNLRNRPTLWAQCDKCEKWRIVFEDFKGNERWECAMHEDLDTCDSPDTEEHKRRKEEWKRVDEEKKNMEKAQMRMESVQRQMGVKKKTRTPRIKKRTATKDKEEDDMYDPTGDRGGGGGSRGRTTRKTPSKRKTKSKASKTSKSATKKKTKKKIPTKRNVSNIPSKKDKELRQEKAIAKIKKVMQATSTIRFLGGLGGSGNNRASSTPRTSAGLSPVTSPQYNSSRRGGIVGRRRGPRVRGVASPPSPRSSKSSSATKRAFATSLATSHSGGGGFVPSQCVLLLGPPGAGKGTQGSLLAEFDNWDHVSCGDLFRQARDNDDELGQEIQNMVRQGQLADAKVHAIDMMLRKIARELAAKGRSRLSSRDPSSSVPQIYLPRGIVLDGCRSIEQAKSMEQSLRPSGLRINVVVVLELSGDHHVMDRCGGRLVHVKSGRVYHRTKNPPKTAGVDDVTGEPLISRRDDMDQSVLETRLELFKSSKLKVCKYFKERDAMIRTIDASGTISTTHTNLVETIFGTMEKAHFLKERRRRGVEKGGVPTRTLLRLPCPFRQWDDEIESDAKAMASPGLLRSLGPSTSTTAAICVLCDANVADAILPTKHFVNSEKQSARIRAREDTAAAAVVADGEQRSRCEPFVWATRTPIEQASGDGVVDPLLSEVASTTNTNTTTAAKGRDGRSVTSFLRNQDDMEGRSGSPWASLLVASPSPSSTIATTTRRRLRLPTSLPTSVVAKSSQRGISLIEALRALRRDLRISLALHTLCSSKYQRWLRETYFRQGRLRESVTTLPFALDVVSDAGPYDHVTTNTTRVYYVLLPPLEQLRVDPYIDLSGRRSVRVDILREMPRAVEQYARLPFDELYAKSRGRPNETMNDAARDHPDHLTIDGMQEQVAVNDSGSTTGGVSATTAPPPVKRKRMKLKKKKKEAAAESSTKAATAVASDNAAKEPTGTAFAVPARCERTPTANAKASSTTGAAAATSTTKSEKGEKLWRSVADTSGTDFFRHSKTGETVPKQLPAAWRAKGWRLVRNSAGTMLYWWNKQTNQREWRLGSHEKHPPGCVQSDANWADSGGGGDYDGYGYAA
eukprot:g2578.t1